MNEASPIETATLELKVAICGAPKVGKMETLLALKKQLAASALQVQALPDRFAELRVDSCSPALTFVTSPGSIFFRERMRALVLERAHAVVFIYSAAAGDAHDSVEDFHGWIQEAERLGKSWDNVPWLFVRNMLDIGQFDPLSGVIPNALNVNRLELIATQGQGIRELMEWVLQVTGAKR